MTIASDTWCARMTNICFERIRLASLWVCDPIVNHTREQIARAKPVIEKYNDKFKNSPLLLSCRWHLHVESDDQKVEAYYQIQPSTDHAASCHLLPIAWPDVPVLAFSVVGSLYRWNSCPWRCGTCRWSRTMGVEKLTNCFLLHFTKCCQCFRKVGTWWNESCSTSLAVQISCPYFFVSESSIPYCNACIMLRTSTIMHIILSIQHMFPKCGRILHLESNNERFVSLLCASIKFCGLMVCSSIYWTTVKSSLVRFMLVKKDFEDLVPLCSDFVFSLTSSCHACFPLATRPMRAIPEIFLKIFFNFSRIESLRPRLDTHVVNDEEDTSLALILENRRMNISLDQHQSKISDQ